MPFEVLNHPMGVILESNNMCGWSNGNIDYMAAIGIIGTTVNDAQSLVNQHINNNDWYFGYITYDYKNNLEDLESRHKPVVEFPTMEFFSPQYIVIKDKAGLRLEYNDTTTPEEAQQFIDNLCSSEHIQQPLKKVTFNEITSRNRYIESVETIKDHIRRGDIYEMNYCISFVADNVNANPAQIWTALNRESPTPFAAFVKSNNNYAISASPERYIFHNNGYLMSQPIKGTAARSSNPSTDIHNRDALQSSEKERAENVMITDLVRNDLSKVAQRGSVNVKELCGIYGFRQVWQMISTIEARLDQGKHWGEAIEATFPMGSMTGAPKYRSMQLIDNYEDAARGLYSGAIGYITPLGIFDFNVVIRSLLYDTDSRKMSYSAGSAITIGSDAAKEYDECAVKASAMRRIFNGQ